MVFYNAPSAHDTATLKNCQQKKADGIDRVYFGPPVDANIKMVTVEITSKAWEVLYYSFQETQKMLCM